MSYNSPAYTHSLEFWPERIGRVIQLGYTHGAAGSPFDSDYDKWPHELQDFYEQGRGIAATILAIGARPPPWPAECLTFAPKPVEAIARHAVELMGQFLPFKTNVAENVPLTEYEYQTTRNEEDSLY